MTGTKRNADRDAVSRKGDRSSHKAGRRRAEVRDIEERKDPEGAWRVQPTFERLMRELGTEGDLLKRLLRMLRVTVRPGSVITPAAWRLILELTDILVRGRTARR